MSEDGARFTCSRAPLFLAGWLFFTSGSAWAGDSDFRLNAVGPDGQGLLFSCVQPVPGGCESFAPRNDRFKRFVSQLGMVLGPRVATPASTVGHAGFELSVMWTGSFVASNQAYWGVTEAAQRTGQANDLLSSLQFDVRKGLPLSFEVATHLQWLVDSDVFAPGFELRWSLEDAHTYAPDLSFRGMLSHMVGQRDLSLTTLGFETIVSREIPVLGLFEVTPYAAWGVLLTSARSGVIDPTPTGFVDSPPPRRTDAENDFVFEDIDFGELINHRLTVGVRMLTYIIDVSVQGEFRIFGEGEPVQSLSLVFGVVF